MKIKVTVIKSNGQEQEFNLAKLRTSILKAYEETNKSPSNIEEILDLLKASIEQFVDEENKISSSNLWDLVEKILLQVGDLDVAKSYILYRGKVHCEKELAEDGIGSYAFYQKVLPASLEWKDTTIAIKTFVEPDWADSASLKIPLKLESVTGIYFTPNISDEIGGTAKVDISELYLIGN